MVRCLASLQLRGAYQNKKKKKQSVEGLNFYKL